LKIKNKKIGGINKMKKALIFLIGFTLLGTTVFSQSPGGNFQKVAKKELLKRETVLLQKRAGIERFLNKTTEDRIVSGKEMKIFKKMVEEFEKTKKKFDKELMFYRLRTTIEIPTEVQRILKIYFVKGKVNFRDNDAQEVRRYFVKKTGKNVVVKNSKNWKVRILLGIFCGLCFAALALGFLSSFEEVENELSVFIVTPVVIFIFMIIMFLFL